MTVVTKAKNLRFMMSLEDIDLAHLHHLLRQVSESIRSESHLLPQNAAGLQEQFEKDLSVIVVDEMGEIVGHATLWLLVDQSSVGEVYELGTTWVHPDYRGHGVNTEMYKHFLERHKGKNILATTTNPASVAVGRQAGLRTIPRKLLPITCWKASCICPSSKTGTKDNISCKLARGEKNANEEGLLCYFRVNTTLSEKLKF